MITADPTTPAKARSVAPVTNTAPGLAHISRLSDPVLRATRAAVLLDQITARHKAEADSVIEVRDAACRELLDAGMSAAEVGRLIRRTRALVAKRFPNAEAAQAG